MRADHRRDHRRGQHRLVEQRRVTFQRGRADAAAHGMAVQVHWATIRRLTPHSLCKRGEIGHISPPIVNPYQTWIAHIVRGMAMPAMLEHAHRIAGQQKVPHHFAVFASEFGESVRNDDRATKYARSAFLAQRVECARVVAVVMQPAGALQLGQRLAFPIDGGRFHPTFRHASLQRRQHRSVHFGVIARLVDERDSHGSILGERRQDETKHRHTRCITMRQCINGVPEQPNRHPRAPSSHTMEV